jgi:hypothetical protein
LRGLLLAIATILPEIPNVSDTCKLKNIVIDYMRDTKGLMFIDNLEDIDEPQVLKFLSREVPAPVKVLITSRTDKQIGSLPVAIDAMSPEEASDLLTSELERLGVALENSDEKFFAEILLEAGGVPLALKWAAQIASQHDSLRVAC